MVCKLKPPSRPIRTGLSHLVGLGKLHGHLGWNGTIAKNHGDTVGSSANTLRQTSTEGHIHTHACVHTIAHHYVDTNMNSTIWEYQTCNKRVAGGSWWVQQRIHGCMCPPSMLLSQFLRGHQMHTPNKYKHVGYNAWITWFVKCSKYQYEYVFLATQFLSG